MARQTIPFYSPNRGEVSRFALARADVDKMRMAADTMINWVPMTMGPMTLRPGTEYLGSVQSDASCRLIEFVYATDDTALIELTDSNLRVWVDDALITRAAVTTTVATFASGTWTAVASTGSSVSTATGALIIKDVTQGNISYAYKSIDTSANKNKSHGLRIPVTKGGNITIKIGSTQGAQDVFPATVLGTGTHSINFTPTVNTCYIQFESYDARSCEIAALSFEAAGPMTLPTPWPASALHSVRYDQSADVIYCAASGYQQRKIERRAYDSWSITLYEAEDGPFPASTGDPTFQFTPGALRGDTTITSNKSFFVDNHIGGLMRLFHVGQDTTQKLNVRDTATDGLVVTGAAEVTYISGTTTTSQSSSERTFTISITGLTGTGNTIALQRTFDTQGLADWTEIATYTTDQSTTYNDHIYNVEVHYRLYMKTYSSGTTTCNLSLGSGGGAGIARIYAIDKTTTPYTAKVQILKAFYGTGSTTQWRMSQWNSSDGWPSSVTIHEGRLWWSGGSRVWGSVSDNYTSFDFEKEGDAAPINRSIGKGPIQNTNFMMSLGRLTIGTDAGIVTARSSSIDEPLTTTKFNVKYTNTQGTADLRAVALDQKGIFVQRSGRRIYMITFTTQSFDYRTDDLTRLNVDIGIPGFTSLAVQRQIDTRFWFVRNDGQIAVLLYDEQDEVLAWFRIKASGYNYATGDGIIENVAILPGTLEDQVYVVVKRIVNGATKRYLEKFGRLDECVGDSVTRLVDAHLTYSGTATTSLTGLGHLEGKTVAVWGAGADGVAKDLGTKTVTSGTISGLSTAVTSAIVGLPYTAQYVSTKLAFAATQGSAINQMKRVNKVGFVLDRTHYQGVRYGQYDVTNDAYTSDNLPLVEDGATTADNTIWQHYDQQQFELNGKWDADSRVYIEAASPRPATVLGFTIEMETSG